MLCLQAGGAGTSGPALSADRIGDIAGRQNADGGWPYIRGKSWTEPTAYAVMALFHSGEQQAARRGAAWLASMQRADGGLAPQAGVEDSTWVTTLALLLPSEICGDALRSGAVRWLMRTTGEETGTIYRLRQRLLGNLRPADQQFSGWPWVPGAAAWVGPTAVSILALDKEGRRASAPQLRARAEEGRSFLLARMCSEGGWNHGSARALGYDSRPYPETTGMALAALRGAPANQLGKSIELALRFLFESRSADAIHWLRLGLLAHRALPADYRVRESVPCRRLSETVLSTLVDQASAGRGVFWS
jgi:hypothetical protein